MDKNKIAALVAGPLLFALLSVIHPFGLDVAASKTLGIILWMLVWWISECVPMGATSLLPIILFPFNGILTLDQVSTAYGNKYVFLFMGGFIIALAMEKWNLHRRLALNIVKRTGVGSDRIILGFFAASFLISMWISNTATALMMFPIAASVTKLLLHEDQKLHGKGEKNFALTLMLSIAYGSSIGGMATLVGSPPNAAMAGILSGSDFNTTVSFSQWFKIGFPFALVLSILSYLLLVKVIYPNRLGKFELGTQIISSELNALGKWKFEEKLVFAVFVTTATLWIFQDMISTWLKSHHIEFTDVTIGIAAGLILFILPSKKEKNEHILEWKDTEKLPWGVLLMFGGGMALSEGFKASGLIKQVTQWMTVLDTSNLFWYVSILCLIGLILTALMSNLAMVNIFVPIVAMLAIQMNIDPAFFAIPVTISASCDFMFPMSTPPNAIAYSSGFIKAKHMFSAGIVLNLLSLLLLMALIYFSV